jgi:hypothetical protein
MWWPVLVLPENIEYVILAISLWLAGALTMNGEERVRRILCSLNTIIWKEILWNQE